MHTWRPPAPSEDDDTALFLPRSEFNEELATFEQLSAMASVIRAHGGGYRVTSLQQGSYLDSLGLRIGDVVTHIDGRPINTPEDAARAYAWLHVTDHFTVDLLRDGHPVQLKFQIGG
jgi:S1-C subfamily serine protease